MADFRARCEAADVLRCVGFDSAADIAGTYGDAHGVLPGQKSAPVIDATVKSSGAGALRFAVAGVGSADSAGSYFTNFSDDLSVQFDTGDEFYVQWRQRFSAAFLQNRYAGGEGWKQVIVGEGDHGGCSSSHASSDTCATSCGPLEVVLINSYHQGLPTLYHSCGGKDDQYEPLIEPKGSDFFLQNALRDPGCLYTQHGAAPCFRYVADEWMTFQLHIKVGTWYANGSRLYKHDSTVQLWMAREGLPSQLIVDFSPQDSACQSQPQSIPGCQTGYDLSNDRKGVAKYGKVWLLPYDTGRDNVTEEPDAYTWYDELVVAKRRIADPSH
jgi:hypothetical protein